MENGSNQDDHRRQCIGTKQQHQQQNPMPPREQDEASGSPSSSGHSYEVRRISSKASLDTLQENSDESTTLNISMGWFGYRPAWAQRFARPGWALFFLCWAGALQGFIVNGLVNVVITTIEKRYRLKSSELGLIAGGYDIAGLFFLVPVSYLGAHRSKLACVASGVLILALGALVFASPYFLVGNYEFSNTQETTLNLCHHGGGGGLGGSEAVQCQAELADGTNFGSSKLSNLKFVFVLGQFLHGVGASPFYTLGCAFIDESVPTQLSSLYVGIFYTMAILGPGMGYMLGGQMLKVYVDWGVDPGGLTPSSSVWVGRWWFGFLIGAMVCLVCAIPISMFPTRLPGQEKVAASKKSEAHKSASKGRAVQDKEFGRRLADLPHSLALLLKNPTFMFLNIAGATDGMLVSALASFLPKVMEQQFSLTQSHAALLMGLISLPGAGGGTFLGGWIVKHWNMNIRQILKTCVLFSGVAAFLTLSFTLNCPTMAFAGQTAAYLYERRSLTASETSYQVKSLVSSCNSACDCSDYHYDPICGRDGVQYFSPCFAGCAKTVFHDGKQYYEDCSCLLGANTSRQILWPRLELSESATGDGDFPPPLDAARERCPSSCNLLPLFVVAVFITMVFTFLTSMPSLSATMRCVPDSQRSFGLGIQWISIRGLGTIPAPLIFGALLDQSCLLWQKSCDSSGSCLLYDNERMARNLFFLGLFLKILTCAAFAGAMLTYKPPSSDAQDDKSGEHDHHDDDGQENDHEQEHNPAPHHHRLMTGDRLSEKSPQNGLNTSHQKVIELQLDRLERLEATNGKSAV